MKYFRKNDGITLIALVITIIIMLILATVSIRIAVNGGLFKYAGKATHSYQIASEREYLEQNVLSVQLEKYLENVSTEKLGKSLADRNLENSSIWDIIVEKAENKTYGTGWNYLEKGTELQDYGKTKYNWVVNYETGEIIQLEDETYDNFNYKSSIAIEKPLFNLDSANVGMNPESWGNNATLYYYDDKTYDSEEARLKAYDEQKNNESVDNNNIGYDRQKSNNIENYLDKETGAFKFNGNNYIEIKNNNGFDFSKGITFEYYGKITGQVAATVTKDENAIWNTWCGLFGFWNGNYKNQCTTRFGFINNLLVYTLQSGGVEKYEPCGEWASPDGDAWNQKKNLGNVLNKDIYVAISIDNNGEDRITQSIHIYMDGQSYHYSGWLLKEYYEKFNEHVKKLNYLELGRCTYGKASNWGYLKGLCYSLRIYDKSLSQEEVQANYDVTTAFHKYIIDSKK